MRGGREDARDGALEAARHGSSETWLWTENRELGQQLQGLKGLGEVWFWRVLFLRSVLLFLDGRHWSESVRLD